MMREHLNVKQKNENVVVKCGQNQWTLIASKKIDTVLVGYEMYTQCVDPLNMESMPNYYGLLRAVS